MGGTPMAKEAREEAKETPGTRGAGSSRTETISEKISASGRKPPRSSTPLCARFGKVIQRARLPQLPRPPRAAAPCASFSSTWI